MKMIRKYIDGKQQYMFTRIGWCQVCGNPFIKKAHGGARKYCEVCSINRKREREREAEKKRPERNEYIAEAMAKGRGNGTIKQNLNGTNTRVCGAPPESKIDPTTEEVIAPTDKEWKEYHNKIKKMKREALGGYQDYHDIDDDYNPYE